jgi:Na+/H+-dicarboxylate symporter
LAQPILLSFGIVSTFARAIGLVMANIRRLGKGMNIDPQKLAGDAVSS